MEFQWNPRGGSSLHCFQVELEFGNVSFCGGRKTLRAGTRTNNKESFRDPLGLLPFRSLTNNIHSGSSRILQDPKITVPSAKEIQLIVQCKLPIESANSFVSEIEASEGVAGITN